MWRADCQTILPCRCFESKLILMVKMSYYATDRPKFGITLDWGAQLSRPIVRKVSVRICLAPLPCPFSFTQQTPSLCVFTGRRLVRRQQRWRWQLWSLQWQGGSDHGGCRRSWQRHCTFYLNCPCLCVGDASASVCLHPSVVTCAAVSPWDCFSRVLLPVSITASSRARRRPRD